MCNWFVVTCQTRGRARCPTAVTGNQTWLGKSLFIDDCPISTSLCLVPTGDVWTAFWGFFARSRLSSASTATSSSSRLLFIIYLRSSPWAPEGKVLPQYVPRFGCYVISYGEKNKHIGLRNCRCATELGLSAIPSVQCDAGCRTWIRTWQGRKSGINWVKLIILSSTIPTNHYKWIYIYIYKNGL